MTDVQDLQNEPGEFANSDDAIVTAVTNKNAGGPKTPWDKAKSSQNAVKHGLCAQATIIEGEDPDELEAMHEEFLADEKPQTATERLLVEQIVMAGWRLRRASRYEGQLLTAKLATVRRERANRAHWKRDDDPETEAQFDLPRAVTGVLAGKAHAQMVRHENAISRELFKAIAELRKVRKERAESSKHKPAQKTPAPPAPPNSNSPVRIRPAELGPPDEPTEDGVMWVRVGTPPSPYANKPNRRR